MSNKPTYEELEQRVNELESEAIKSMQIESALKESLVEVSAILDHIPLIMLIVDQDRRVKKISKSATQFTGRLEKEMIGLRGGEALRCIYHLDDPKGCGFGVACETCVLRLTVLDTFKTGNSYQKVEANLSFQDDVVDERTLHISTGQLDTLDKKVLVCVEDISKSKEAEKALKENEQRYRSLIEDVIESSNIGIFILDSEFKIVWTNQALARYFDLGNEDILGKDKRRLIQEKIKFRFDESEAFADKVLATYEDNTYIENFECLIFPGNKKKERWLEHWSRPIRSGLYTEGRIELYYDITDRKRVEEKLQKAREGLEQRVKERTADLTKSNYQLKQEIKERSRTERLLYEKEKKLIQQTKNLGKVNTALKVLIEQQDKEKRKIEKNILSNVKKLIFPYIHKMQKSSLDTDNQTYLSIVESNLKNLISPFVENLSLSSRGLTPREIQIADLIRHGKTSKEIAEMLSVSFHAVSVHRYKIRKKLSLLNEKINLNSFLQTIG